MSTRNQRRHDGTNATPITRAHSTHSNGTGLGAALWAAAAARAAAGTVDGGLTDTRVAEALEPTEDDAFCSDNYSDRDYVETGSIEDDDGYAYELGGNAFSRYPRRSLDETEPEMLREWTDHGGSSAPNWDRARPAARDAWNRVNGTY